MCLSRKTYPTPRLMNQRTGDFHYRWTKKWGAGHLAYWLYLAHLPLIIAAQLAVKDWPIPALAKFLLIVTVVTSFLLWTYQTLVRYTWLGRSLNGPRARPARAGAPAVAA